MSVKTPNLRFLMALGGKRIVVVQDQDDTHVYTDIRPSRNKVSVQRICDALLSK